ncbi:MAG: 3-coathanger stack domain-containing protein [Dehalococcoidia bacterium]
MPGCSRVKVTFSRLVVHTAEDFEGLYNAGKIVIGDVGGPPFVTSIMTVIVGSILDHTTDWEKWFGIGGEPGDSAEWRLTIQVRNPINGVEQTLKWERDGVEDGKEYPINHAFEIDVFAIPYFELVVSGYEEDDFSRNDIIPPASARHSSEDEWGIGLKRALASKITGDYIYTIHYEVVPVEVERVSISKEINYRAGWDLTVTALRAIESRATIDPEGEITFQAGNRVALLGGFHAKAGSNFHAGTRWPGYPPIINVYPGSVDFPVVSSNRESTLDIAIHNTGYLPLEISARVEGESFSLAGESVKSIPSGGGHALAVTFIYGSPGFHQGHLVIEHNDPARPLLRIPLQGFRDRG